MHCSRRTFIRGMGLGLTFSPWTTGCNNTTEGQKVILPTSSSPAAGGIHNVLPNAKNKIIRKVDISMTL